MFKNTEIKKLGWYYIWALVIAACMVFANFSGWRILSFNGQEKWAAGGPTGYHK